MCGVSAWGSQEPRGTCALNASMEGLSLGGSESRGPWAGGLWWPHLRSFSVQMSWRLENHILVTRTRSRSQGAEMRAQKPWTMGGSGGKGQGRGGRRGQAGAGWQLVGLKWLPPARGARWASRALRLRAFHQPALSSDSKGKRWSLEAQASSLGRPSSPGRWCCGGPPGPFRGGRWAVAPGLPWEADSRIRCTIPSAGFSLHTRKGP